MSKKEWQTGLMIIQGNRPETLRDLMTEWIKRHPLAPFEQEHILVQSNGIAQWLKMALARPQSQGGLGIAAAIKVDLPMRFLWQGYRAFMPEIPSLTPFDKGPLTWLLYHLFSDIDAVKGAVSDATVLAPLLSYLEQDPSPRRVYQLAGKLADLYDQYQVYRPDWLQEWQQGIDTLVDDQAQYRWQPHIWRLIKQHIALDPAQAQSRADVHAQVINICRTSTTAPAELPKRVLIFGISALPYTVLEFLDAISPFCQVLLFVHTPSQYYWGDLVEGKDLLRQHHKRASSHTHLAGQVPQHLHLCGNPLLASWGKQGRDYLQLLAEHDQPDRYRDFFNQRTGSSIDVFESPCEASHTTPSTLLTQLQDDIYELRSVQQRQALCQAPGYTLDLEKDCSLLFYEAHSALREVEILHDMLLHEFEQATLTGSGLEPRDILVMVPDINTYAPHIHAVFGRYKSLEGEVANDKRYIPFHIADQSQRGVNKLLNAFETLLHAVDARFSVSELLDLLDTPALLARFGLLQEQVPRLHRWIKEANIRWGLNDAHRQEVGFRHIEPQNTWLFGLERMLLGYASGADSHWQGIEPYDEVTGLEAEMLGPLIELINALIDLRQQLQHPRTAAAWEMMITQQLCSQFFKPQSATDARVLDSISAALSQWCEHCALVHCGESLMPIEVLRDELMNQIDKPSLSQKFLGGSVNFATLMPMRAIPFSQIWLLGMNDGDYPRAHHVSDFDLMAKSYRPGDRSRREDDRYLFLEAILSARQKLVISWVARNIRDNSERPSSVLVGQLRDYLTEGWQPLFPVRKDCKGLATRLTTMHPLQPFSRAYFQQQKNDRLFTYATEWRQVHEPRPAHNADMPPLLLETNLNLKMLATFLRYPLKTLFEQRLGVKSFDQDDTTEDDETFVMGGLASWSLYDHLIKQVLTANKQNPTHDLEDALQQTIARAAAAGLLPHAGFSAHARQQMLQHLLPALAAFDAMKKAYPEVLAGHRHTWPLGTVKANGESLAFDDVVPELRQAHGQAQEAIRLIISPSRLFAGEQKIENIKHYHLVKYWPEHLLAQLQIPTTTYLFSVGGDKPFELAPLPHETAKNLLNTLAHHCLEALTTPLPVACKAGIAQVRGKNASSEYFDEFRQAGDRIDYRLYARFWQDFEALTACGRFDELSQALYAPLVTHSSAIDVTTAEEQDA